MYHWPDAGESLLTRFVEQLGYRETATYRSWLRQFQRFVQQHSPNGKLTERVFRAWIRNRARESTRSFGIRQTEFVKNFLDWLVAENVLHGHPLQHLQRKYECRSIRAIAGALMSLNPNQALEALRPLPRYGSHLGAVIRQHIQRMRTLGYRYGHEAAFLHFDRFLQERVGASQESLETLIREYVARASSPNGKLRRLILGRLLAKALNRHGVPVAVPRIDRLWLRQDRNNRCHPYIYTVAEVERLLETARRYPSPRAPLRPLTLYTMLALAYSAGLRLGEIVRLKLKDVDLLDGCIEIRETKFFKSRRLPLSATAISALSDYLKARRKAGAPSDPDSTVFWHNRKGYSYSTAGHLLYRVIHDAGIRTKAGKPPRVHDVRHAFTVHRLTSWYQDGIQPESRLPYLASYLGHRDINSTLVYLTMTDELLERANQRFRTAEMEIVKSLPRGTH
jgi:site-specific recombinase XerD